jgi:hypothetical protein
LQTIIIPLNEKLAQKGVYSFIGKLSCLLKYGRDPDKLKYTEKAEYEVIVDINIADKTQRVIFRRLGDSEDGAPAPLAT